MSSSVLSQLALDDVVDGFSPDLTSLPHSRASKKPRANQCSTARTVRVIPPHHAITTHPAGYEWVHEDVFILRYRGNSPRHHNS
jgi:hypothetical protein